MLIVILIIAAISMIALPRINNASIKAKEEACGANLRSINSAIERFRFTTGAYPTDIAAEIYNNTSYFPDGAPTCPLGGTYTYGGNNRVTCNH